MKNILVMLMSISVGLVYAQQEDSIMIKKIFNETLSHGTAYSNLKFLTGKIGGRLSGSPQAAAAVEWAKQAMKDAGADTVYLQEMMVPHWVRGEKEFGKIVNSKVLGSQEVPVCALGGSIATSINGITAEVIEVHDFQELASLGKKNVEGKIVFFNRPMDPNQVNTFNAYGGAANQRVQGASQAAKYGAIGIAIRSLNLSQDDYPHTGVMIYNDSFPKIPACALSTNGANLLSRILKNDPSLKFHFKMSCETLSDVKSYNVVGEIRGFENVEEIITVGGHLDSWDTGEGAHDDGAGVVQSIEVLRVIKALNLKPKRTIRAVAFMNEENGACGGRKYGELAKLKKEKHIAALESDEGGFAPIGFSFEVTVEKMEKIKLWEKFFTPYGLRDFDQEGSGVDISFLKELGASLIALRPESQRYFDYHHASSDTFDKINKRELEMGAGSISALIYLISKYGL